MLYFFNVVNCISQIPSTELLSILVGRWKGGMKEAGDKISCIYSMLSVVFLKFRQQYFFQF